MTITNGVNLYAPLINQFIIESPGGRLIGDRWREDPVVPILLKIEEGVLDALGTNLNDVEIRLVRAVAEMIGTNYERVNAEDNGLFVFRIGVPLIVAEHLQWYSGDEGHFFEVERLPGMVF